MIRRSFQVRPPSRERAMYVCVDGQGLARLLADHGFTIVAQVDTGEALLAATAAHAPDVVIVDIRMPPTFTDEGLRAAQQLRARHPRLGVLVLSQYVDVTYALKLIHEGGQRLGYLLKDRIVDVHAHADSLRRLAGGECVIEPALVEALVRSNPLAELTTREREVLALMAEGRTDRGIRDALYLSQKTVESHTRSIFRKLALPSSPNDNRRVHAVLAFLRETEHQPASTARQ
ncbi:MAG TPA: response regulator transcription factor [Solirubrobacter sp.]|nr:response regulator transcription factor [Solirubrobacter sp.]